ncbi:hypothetical protein ACJ73_09265, partial [Blastomyces percursus]
MSWFIAHVELAKEVGSGRSGARHQTGTMEFMVIEVLLNVQSYRVPDDDDEFFNAWRHVRGCLSNTAPATKPPPRGIRRASA